MFMRDAIAEYCFDCRIRKLSPGTIEDTAAELMVIEVEQ